MATKTIIEEINKLEQQHNEDLCLAKSARCRLCPKHRADIMRENKQLKMTIKILKANLVARQDSSVQLHMLKNYKIELAKRCHEFQIKNGELLDQVCTLKKNNLALSRTNRQLEQTVDMLT